jgi:acylphosphatase
LPDGSVEALFEGEDQALNKIVSWCKKGPIGARVDRVEAKEEKYKGEFEEFSIIY